MDILVIAGQVPATDLSIEYDPRLGGVNPNDLVYIASPWGLHAVEEALRIRESHQGSVTVIAAGPDRLDAALRHYLSMGADKAVRIYDRLLEKSDTYCLSMALSQAIRGLKYDLILFEGETTDDLGGTVYPAPYVAEMLGIPHVAGVTRVEMREDRKAVIHRKSARGNREVLRCHLPCLFSLERNINEPRYPTFPESLASMKKDIQVTDLASLAADAGNSLVSPVRVALPAGRVKKGLTIDTRLSASERMKIVMSGGSSSRSTKQTMLTGEPNKLAEQIVTVLVNQEIVRKAKGS